MKRLIPCWHALCTIRNDELRSMRVLALGAFLAIIAALVARPHADFFLGLAVGLLAVLAIQLFSAKSARSRTDAEESQTAELHLSR